MLTEVAVNQGVRKSVQCITQFLHLLISERSVSEDAPTLCKGDFRHKNRPVAGAQRERIEVVVPLTIYAKIRKNGLQ